jgi:hypothetical protein
MTPTACHRIVEQGENKEHFHSFASALLLRALVPLALGIAGDFFVVIECRDRGRDRARDPLAAVAVPLTLLLLCLFFGLCFGVPLLRRRRDRKFRRSEMRAV